MYPEYSLYHYQISYTLSFQCLHQQLYDIGPDSSFVHFASAEVCYVCMHV